MVREARYPSKDIITPPKFLNECPVRMTTFGGWVIGSSGTRIAGSATLLIGPHGCKGRPKKMYQLLQPFSTPPVKGWNCFQINTHIPCGYLTQKECPRPRLEEGEKEIQTERERERGKIRLHIIAYQLFSMIDTTTDDDEASHACSIQFSHSGRRLEFSSSSSAAL